MKPTLILVTGWSYGPESLGHLARDLAGSCDVKLFNHHQLVARASMATLFPCSDYARGLIAWLDEQPEPCWIGGWSMGGMIALETAAQMPRLVKGLVLMDATAKFLSDEFYVCGVAPMHLHSMMRQLKKSHRSVLRRFYGSVARPYSPDVARIPEWTQGMQNGLAYLEATDLRKAAKRINMPALILHGEEDAVIPLDAGKTLNKLIPNSKFASYYGVGHDLPLRKSKTLAKEIAAFMKDHST